MKRLYRLLLIFFTLVCYLSVFVSPGNFWPAGFLTLAIPVFLLFHFTMIFVKIGKPTSSVMYLLLLLTGLPFVQMSFQLSSSEPPPESAFEVLSYNVRVFNNYSHLNENFTSSKEMVDWVVGNDAPIKCFQEFYNQDASKIFNVKEKLISAGWKHFNQRTRFKDRSGAEFGQAIFSKYPILKNGEVKDEQGEFMNTIYSDVLIGDDTVRIYCMHLKSMSIDEDNIVDTEKLKNSYIDTGYRLKGGFIARSKQVKFLEENIKSMPYAVIVCGDMNELPYSYPYVKLRRFLNNAFEKKGIGFGFTYNGKLFFLRIDNQFFSDDVEVYDYTTHRQVKPSDHFPISAVYAVK